MSTISPQFAHGFLLARATYVGVKDYRELIAWQLGDKLRRLTCRMTSEGPAAADLRFRGQIEDAAASVCRNVAEGFGRFNPREFLQFVKYARSSLAELQDELHDGLQRRYFTDDDFNEAWTLTVRTNAALASLGRYLRSRRASRNAEAITRRQSDRIDRSDKDEP